MTTLRTLFDSQNERFLAGTTRSRQWRLDQLDRLERMLSENRLAFKNALALDFKTAWFEQDMEFDMTLGSVVEARNQLDEWMAPVEAPLSARLTRSGHRGTIHREPYGVCLIIAPFNAPIALTLEPLIAALSAGNTAIVKPAETTARTAALFEELLGRYFERDAVAVVRGNRTVIAELLALPFDFIFFTGSTQVGKIVMRAAAENLTPVLLELGGQNPVIVDATANLPDAAEKIVWAAMAFGGQWCTSPGYVHVHESVADEFADDCKAAITRMYGPDPSLSADLSRIVSSRDVDRLAALLVGANVIAGGQHDRETRYFAPTLVYPAHRDEELMAQELFGPILPILPYADIDTVLHDIARKPRSLAGYIFSRDQASIDKFVHGLSFGGGAVNQTMLQCFMTSSMPFGGVGASGLGRYYGKFGFDALSHAKSIVTSPPDVRIDALLPPYSSDKSAQMAEWFATPGGGA